jgi:hypothetical protein
MTRHMKNESARCNTYCACYAHQHRHGAADKIEATRARREIRYDDDYEHLYNRAR